MGEKRKPVMTFLLKIPGKRTHKVELFRATDFIERWRYGLHRDMAARYRVRSDGKWLGKKGKGNAKTFLTWYEFRDLLWSSMKNLFSAKAGGYRRP